MKKLNQFAEHLSKVLIAAGVIVLVCIVMARVILAALLALVQFVVYMAVVILVLGTIVLAIRHAWKTRNREEKEKTE